MFRTRAVQAADEDLGSLLLIRAARVELRCGDVRVPAAVQTPGEIDRRVIPWIGGWTPDRRLTLVVEHADSGYLRGPRTRGHRQDGEHRCRHSKRELPIHCASPYGLDFF